MKFLIRWPMFVFMALTITCVQPESRAAEPNANSDAKALGNPTAPIRYRGFTLNFDPGTLKKAADWGANHGRFFISPPEIGRAPWNRSGREIDFDQMLNNGLDAARQAGIAVTLVIPQMSSIQPGNKADKKARCAAFWDNDINLQKLVDAWKNVARICKGRDQVIWYDLLNEPLDWRDFPSYPKKWPAWSQTVIDAIREIDPTTPIAIETGPGGLCSGAATFPFPERGGPFILSIHSYQPHEFTHQGIENIQGTDLAQSYLEHQRSWPGLFGDGKTTETWNREWLEKKLAPAIEFQKRHPDIPIHVGEFSAVRWAPGAANYLRDSIEIFEKYGWHWDYHCLVGYTGWNLEHDNADSSVRDNKVAPTLTDRAQVLRGFLARN
jgi:aryl-phospho-beta-D-glucosidase BglC (GH1 family)